MNRTMPFRCLEQIVHFGSGLVRRRSPTGKGLIVLERSWRCLDPLGVGGAANASATTMHIVCIGSVQFACHTFPVDGFRNFQLLTEVVSSFTGLRPEDCPNPDLLDNGSDDEYEPTMEELQRSENAPRHAYVEPLPPVEAKAPAHDFAIPAALPVCI